MWPSSGRGCDRLNKERTDLLLWGWKLRLSWNKNIIFRVMIYGLNLHLIAGHKYRQMVLRHLLRTLGTHSSLFYMAIMNSMQAQTLFERHYFPQRSLCSWQSSRSNFRTPQPHLWCQACKQIWEKAVGALTEMPSFTFISCHMPLAQMHTLWLVLPLQSSETAELYWV